MKTKVHHLHIGDKFKLLKDGSVWKVKGLCRAFRRGYHVNDGTVCIPLEGEAYDRLESRRANPSPYIDAEGPRVLNRNMNIELLEEGPKVAHRLSFGKHKGKLFTEVDESYLQWCVDNCSQLFNRQEVLWIHENILTHNK